MKSIQRINCETCRVAADSLCLELIYHTWAKLQVSEDMHDV